MTISFKEVADRLCLSAEDLADMFGLRPQTIRQARLAPASKGYREPPLGWELELARLAKTKSAEFLKLSADLERQGSD